MSERTKAVFERIERQRAEDLAAGRIQIVKVRVGEEDPDTSRVARYAIVQDLGPETPREPIRAVVRVDDPNAYREALLWLERRGRVKARKFGSADDNWVWDQRDGSLLDAIQRQMRAERECAASDASTRHAS